MGLDAGLRFVGGIAVIDLKGRLAFGAEGEHLRETLVQIFDKGHTRILLNMEALQHADSGGLGDLVSAYAAITRRGGIIKLAQLRPKIRSMLQMTHIDALFEICEDEASALNTFPREDPRPAGTLSDMLND